MEDVAHAIQALNGRDRTLVTLEIDDHHHMGVGGGDGGYIVYLTVDSLQFKNLVVVGKEGPLVKLVCGGQEGEFAAKQCVDLATAQQAALTFAETGQPDLKLSWEG